MSIKPLQPFNLDQTKNYTFNGVSIANVANLTIPGGTSGQVLSTDGSGHLSWTTASGGGTPGGANTQIQFNDASSFGGSAGLTFDKTTNALSVTGNVSAGNVITSGIFYPNGVAYSTGGGAGGYGDSNVVTLLGTFGSNTITTTGNITGGNLIASTGSGGNITGASIISSNAFIANSQTTLGSAVVGQIDRDSSAIYLADNTTSGRGVLQPVNMFRYTSAGSATATTITDYFPASSSLNLEANSIYEVEAHCYFLKTTAGTAVWTWAFSSGVNMARSYYISSPITGFTTTVVTGAALGGYAVQQGGAVTAMAHAATGSLTTGVYHSFHFKVFVVTNAATNIRLRVTNSAGTITPQAGSFYYVKKLSANAGVFAA